MILVFILAAICCFFAWPQILNLYLLIRARGGDCLRFGENQSENAAANSWPLRLTPLRHRKSMAQRGRRRPTEDTAI